MTRLDRFFKPLAIKLHEGHMRRLGIARTMHLAHSYNRLKFRHQDIQRRHLYQHRFAELIRENGALARPATVMKDGWAVDTSLSLPHLDRVLADSDRIIAERKGVRKSTAGTYRSYFQDVWTAEDAVRFPSFLDFASSSDVLSVVAGYLQSLPALSTTLPSGIRFVESNAEFDDQPNEPHDSQLYHIDYYSLPNVYVLVLLQDTTFEHGPWTFLPRSLSQQVKHALGYWEQGKGYRMSDDEVHSVASREDVLEFSFPRGTVLYIESSGCLHFGSRNSVKPRFQLMLGYTGACRTDFTEAFMTPKVYPVKEGDSRLRRWLLEKNRLE